MAIEQQNESKASVSEQAADDEDDEVSSSLPLDHIFEILKNERRRTVLRILSDRDAEIRLGELAEEVAAVENDTTVAAITSDQRKRVYVGLYQCHLPKMDEMGIVEFNKNRGRIRPGPNIGQVVRYLGYNASDSTEWHRVYLGVTGGGVIALGASVAGASAVGFTPIAAFALVLASLGCCSVVHATQS